VTNLVGRAASTRLQADFTAMPPVPKPPTAKSGRNRNLVIALVVAAVVVAALIAASLLRSSGDDEDSAATTATAESTATDTTASSATSPALALVAGIPQDGTVLGKAGTTVRLLQFEDLQCPICKRYTDEAFPAIVNEYVRTGRIKIDFRGLAFLGPDSLKALKIAMAAGLQNKLWQVVGLFYENQGAENSGWVTDSLIDQILADVPGLDAAKVKVDAKSAEVSNQIAAVQAEATKLKVQGTPWFYLAVGFNPPVNFQPSSFAPSEFRTPIDQALKAGAQ
jgi:protein-disulfide isomerase